MQIYVGDKCFDIVKETSKRLTDSAGRTWFKPDEDGRLSRYGNNDGIRYAVTAERRAIELQEKAALKRTLEINRLSYACDLYSYSAYNAQSSTMERVTTKIALLTEQLAAAKELEDLLKGETV